jgi:hypothetical protein
MKNTRPPNAPSNFPANIPSNIPSRRFKGKGPAASDEWSSRTMILGGIVAVGLAFLFVQYSKKKSVADARKLRESIAGEAVSIQAESREAERGETAPVIFKQEAPATEKPQDEASIAKELTLLEARSGLGIRNQPYFKDASGKRVIRVRIVAQPRCGAGDYEAIEGDFQRNKFSALLVSLESVKPDGAALVYDAKSVGLSSVYVGTTVQLAAPERSGPAPASVYVCTDSGPKNCTSKSVVGIDSLLLTRFNTPDAPPDGAGKIYYQNYVELGEEGVGVTSDIDARSDSFAGQFTDYGRKLAAISGESSDRAFQKFAEHGRVLYSESLKAEDDGVIVVNLPRDEQSLCPKSE